MGFISDIVGGITGSGADAAEEAADQQVRATEIAVEEQRRAREQARKDLSPFREAGRRQIAGAYGGINRLQRQQQRVNQLAGGLQTRALEIDQLTRSPREQRRFIENNQFFDALAGDAQDRLFSNAAAQGKVGSGGTAEALQNSILLLGADLLNQNIQQRLGAFGARQGAVNASAAAFDAQNAVQSQRQNMVTGGQNAAAGQATATLQAGSNISDLATQIGNAQAAGTIGARNAQTGALNTVLSAGALALSDRRAKKDITQVGMTDGGLPVYTYRYKGGDDTVHMGVMAQEAEKKNPRAVKTIGDLKYVNYAEVA